jgi:hypothetical protein
MVTRGMVKTGTKGHVPQKKICGCLMWGRHQDA